MIRFDAVSKYYPVHGGLTRVLDKVNLTIGTSEKVGILGRNGAGKSTTIRLLSGAELPSSGKITRDFSISWPLAFGGAFQTALTGHDNLRLICRIYGRDVVKCIDFVRDFSEIGSYFYEPLKTYSSGMRARLAFAISMIIEFDCFLIDEVVSVGDSRFHAKCHAELFEKRSDRAFVIVSHDVEYIRTHCNRVYVLSDGKMSGFDDVDAGINSYLGGS